MKPEPVSSDGTSQPRVIQRAALYLRVSTARQAEHDVSIPDQKRQGAACNWSRPSWSRAHRPPTTAAPSSSA